MKRVLILLFIPAMTLALQTVTAKEGIGDIIFIENKDLELRNNESVIEKKPANHLVGNEFVGGKLYLTNQRLVFKSHGLNFNNNQVSFELTEIQNAVKSKLFNGMIIILKNGEEKPFVVFGRKKLINKINDLRQ